MKKTISIILTVTILVISLFCINASAAESKTEAILKQIAETQSVSIAFRDGSLDFSGLQFTDVNLSAKVFAKNDETKEVKISVTGKVYDMFVHIITDSKGTYAYIPSLKMKFNVESLLGEDINITEYADAISIIFDFVGSEYIDCLKLNSTGEKEIGGYGTVYFEELVPDVAAIAQKAIDNGAVILPDGVDVSELTEQELLEYIALANKDDDACAILQMLNTSAEFYYIGNDLIGYKTVTVDADGNEIIIDTTENNSNAITRISSNVPDEEFSVTGKYFNLTFLAFIIIPIVLLLKQKQYFIFK